MTLAMVPVGETREIEMLKGRDEMKKHLNDLGFVEGEKVSIVSETPSGIILQCKGVRLAVDRSLASRIVVR
ncbi:MAG: FeoA family protein [Eubacteriales bacterium]|nr:FeoA family protein [Eubacteriales bacterium]